MHRFSEVAISQPTVEFHAIMFEENTSVQWRCIQIVTDAKGEGLGAGTPRALTILNVQIW